MMKSDTLWSEAWLELEALGDKDVEFFDSYKEAEKKHIGNNTECIVDVYEGSLVDSFIVYKGLNTERNYTLLLETYINSGSSGITVYCFDNDKVFDTWTDVFREAYFEKYPEER